MTGRLVAALGRRSRTTPPADARGARLVGLLVVASALAPARHPARRTARWRRRLARRARGRTAPAPLARAHLPGGWPREACGGRFLAGYLPFLYGRGSARSIEAVTPRLGRQLTGARRFGHAGGAPPSIRVGLARPRSIRPRGLLATALVADGGVTPTRCGSCCGRAGRLAGQQRRRRVSAGRAGPDSQAHHPDPDRRGGQRPAAAGRGAALICVLIGQSCSGGTGVADSASQVAQRDIPANFLAIYESVGARYRIPWESWPGSARRSATTAAIPLPRARRSRARLARASRISPARRDRCRSASAAAAAGDEYDALRHYLPDPALGPHDPTTAVELAALVLIKDKGAPTGQPIDAYLALRRGVQRLRSRSPAAYADRVIADAHAYQGAGHPRRSPAASRRPRARYINPFAGEAWAPSRNDQGVDYDPLKVEPIRAIGAGTIVGIGSWGSLRAVV